MEAIPYDVTVDHWVQTRWTNIDEDPPFHRKQYSPSLVKYCKLLSTSEGTHGRVFVPLCGKSLDMVFLADQGFDVVGLEYSEGAIKRFHEENSLTYTKELLENASFELYYTKEKNIKIYRGDFFNMNLDICGKFDAVFDRASYVAINVSTQKKYSDFMASIVKHGGAILLEAISYESATYLGTPHSISQENIRKNFTDFKISVIETFEHDAPPHIVVDGMKFQITVNLLQRT